MKKISVFFVILLAFIFTACDIIEKDQYIKEGGSQTGTGRKFVFFEFTGHKCPYCPAGQREIQRLSEVYKDQVVAIAVHGGNFAEVNTTGDKFTYDFTTPVGDELYDFYSPNFFPAGVINQVATDSEVLLKSKWGLELAELSLLPEVVKLEIEPSYEDNTIGARVVVKSLVDIPNNLKLAVYCLEDSIINWQIDNEANPTEVENYIHRHVLRASFGPTFGETISTSPSTFGSIYEKTVTMQKGADWNINNCMIVAYVYNETTMEVLQAEEIHVIPLEE